MAEKIEVKFSADNMVEKLLEAQANIRENKNHIETELICNAILNEYPGHPQALGMLGTLFALKGFHTLGIYLLEIALTKETDPNNKCAFHNNIGHILKTQKFDNEQSRKQFELAISYSKKDPEALINYASTYVTSGDPKKALEYIDEALKLAPDHSEGHWNKALALLEAGDYKNGFEEYNHKYRADTKTNRNYGFPEWDGSPGKTVIIYGEQAIGDEIIFASLIPEIVKISKHVIFDAHPRLCDIFRRSFPYIPIYGTRKCPAIEWVGNHPDIDAQCSIASALKYFRKDEKDFLGEPYLKADPKLIELYKNKFKELGDKPKIGISWKGGTPGTGSKYRKFDLELFKPIFDAVDADFISLQYTEHAAESVKAFEEKHPGYKVHHWQQTIDDYDHTAAMVSELDLVISVPQSVVCLAGALGTQTYQITPKRVLWQAGVYGRDYLPWHKSVKVFWQDDTESWPYVINQVKEELCRLSQTNTEK